MLEVNSNKEHFPFCPTGICILVLHVWFCLCESFVLGAYKFTPSSYFLNGVVLNNAKLSQIYIGITYAFEICSVSCLILREVSMFIDRITEWLVLERTSEMILFQPPGHGQS